MAKLLVYDLNLQPCDDYQLKKVLGNTIDILSSEDEEELIVDDDEQDILGMEDFAVCPDYSRDSNDYVRHTPQSTTTKTTMTLRCRKNIKSLAYLDLRPDTPSECESDIEDTSSTESARNNLNDFCQPSNGSYDNNLKLIKMKEEELNDIDVGTNDFPEQNLSRDLGTPFEDSNSLDDFNTTSRYSSSNYVQIVTSVNKAYLQSKNANDLVAKPKEGRRYHNIQETIRRHDMKKLFDNLKEVIPSLRSQNVCTKIKILAEAKQFCSQLQNEEWIWKHLKSKQMKINKKLRKELRNLICDTVF